MISVVIPVRNAAWCIGDQLGALTQQECGDEWEVVVADNGSTDGTRSVVSSFTGSLPGLRVIDASARRGAGPARNAGVRASSGETVAFCDADDVVEPGWLGAIAEASATVTTGPIALVTCGSTGPAGYNSHTFLGVPVAPSNNLALPRAVFELVGGFDETVRLAEDVDLSLRLRAAGHAVVRHDAQVVRARERDGELAFLRQHFAYGIWDVEVFMRHRGEGLRPASPRAVAKAYAGILGWSPRVFAPSATRRTVLAPAAQRAGRIVGSVRCRTLCL